ncbi:MAG: beta-glucosidase BglX [Bdellovibrionales bacterium CG10_big_fil_rev_8_21_14_0_10_45_34]|nr:MAG: beta-glucosidase BglX [Bdellovibrionales bacterium CG10_big_fil_rev_8_21_14_0_10_45_34]
MLRSTFQFCQVALLLLSSGAPIAALSDQKMNRFIDQLMSQMTLEEKIGQMTQYSANMAQTGVNLPQNYEREVLRGRVGSIFNAYTPEFTLKMQRLAVEQTRLKIPLLYGFDVVHGHRTVFPIPLAESSSWDLHLMQATARIAAAEAAADGLHWTFAPMVDVARDPRWGRVSESTGEDPWLNSLIAAARVRGFQGEVLSDPTRVMACVKHFAAYGAAEGGRDYNVVDISKRELFETYLPPFLAAIKAGVGSLMTAFNDISGVPATADGWLLRDILRDRWGFTGFVVSDYTAIPELIPHGVASNLEHAAELAINAGVDMEMQGSTYIDHVENLIRSGRVNVKTVDEAVRRLLAAKYKLGLFDDPYRNVSKERAARVLMAPTHLQVARQMARKSIVLLKNDKQVLPIKAGEKIALIGPLADRKRDMIGNWSGAGDWRIAVSLRDGLSEAYGSKRLNYARGSNILEDRDLLAFLNQHGGEIDIDPRSPAEMIREAVSVAKRSDVIVVALGETQGMSGEAASRTQIRVPENQLLLLRALRTLNKPIVLVLMNGRPLVLEEESQLADAILETWFLGTQGGHAIADILLGRENPSGKLTMSFPRDEGQIPVYYSHRNTGRPQLSGGDRWVSRYIDSANEPLYPFGWGLSYTQFEYSDLQLSAGAIKPDQKLVVNVTVSNAGSRAGEETVQLYIRDLVGSITRPLKQLRGFKKVYLEAGKSQTVQFELTLEDLKFYNRKLTFAAEPGDFEVMVGGNSKEFLKSNFRLTD